MEKQAFKVEKKIPLPETGGGGNGNTKYPFATMKVGDSFKFPKPMRKAITATAWTYARRHKVKFTVRTVEGGMRVWRIN